MQDLQADARLLFVHGVGDQAVPRASSRRAESLPANGAIHPAAVRRDAAGDDQRDAAAGAFAEIGREFRVVAGAILEPGVHRAHDHAVPQLDALNAQRLEQVRIGRHGSES